ncbi:hypothetical protein TAMA11512_09260 [Selenomonas sp. TAMA-11512]|uniref:hypothetical protein n=1 Tax=Selenomonas sp. TAMA-11512 TaxID=3095337 RepID=UPI003088797E|nr:hypothetical protein TAMA11512_09260 [Selenomonas sp. TAMA-11512]
MAKAGYKALFDNEGHLLDSYQGSVKKEGYIQISADDWEHYVGMHGMGENGTGYVRDGESGKPVSAPPDNVLNTSAEDTKTEDINASILEAVAGLYEAVERIESAQKGGVQA